MKLEWDKIGERLYETGVKMGVLYPQGDDGDYPEGVAWNGLTAVNETPSGAEASPFYADDVKYLNLVSIEEFGASVEAYMYPDEFKPCIGEVELVPGVSITQQTRKPFGMCYRTTIGNDVKGNDYGYKLHLVYGATAAVSEKSYSSVNESPEPMTMSWELTTTPVQVTGHKPTAHMEIDSTKVDPTKLAALEAVLYGDESNEPRLPLPDEIAELLKTA